MNKLFLFDIEGTTTDINFVHKVLFPYSAKNLESFILGHQANPIVKKALEEVKNTVREEEKRELELTGVIQQLQTWIKEDRKHGALKEIQGLIWDNGYSKKDFQGHIYDDVKPFFDKILENNSKIGIYSSGSVHAQKLIFGYSIAGDLTPMISYFFDTKVGAKREISSYDKIAKQVNLPPASIHFFSDIPEELEAAEAAGLQVTQVLREGTKSSRFDGIQNFHVLMSIL